MKRFAVLALIGLAGCVSDAPVTQGTSATLIDVGGAVYSVRLVPDMPTYGMMVSADGGTTSAQELERRAPTVVVGGAPDRQSAIQAMIKFCAGRDAVVSSNWDTDYVHFDRSRGEWLFPDVCT